MAFFRQQTSGRGSIKISRSLGDLSQATIAEIHSTSRDDLVLAVPAKLERCQTDPAIQSMASEKILELQTAEPKSPDTSSDTSSDAGIDPAVIELFAAQARAHAQELANELAKAEAVEAKRELDRRRGSEADLAKLIESGSHSDMNLIKRRCSSETNLSGGYFKQATSAMSLAVQDTASVSSPRSSRFGSIKT